MDALRRKFARPKDDAPPPSDLGGFALSLARAARDRLTVVPEIGAPQTRQASLAELVERAPENALIALLDRDGAAATGCLLISAPVLSGLIEVMTTGALSLAPVIARKPTRTDAAMMSGLIDAALAGLGDAGAPWRYAAHLPEARPLPLVLDDGAFRLWQADLTFAGSERAGAVILALPVAPLAAAQPAAVPDSFAQDLAHRIEAAEARMDAVLSRLSLPLAQVMALGAGDVLPLAGTTLEEVRLHGTDGRIIGAGRLGEMRGMRALRLSHLPDASGTVAAPVPVAVTDWPALTGRAAI